MSVGSDNDTDTTHAASLVKDGKATLDFRNRPSRESLGLAQGRRSAGYDSGADPIDVTVLLPGGTSAHIAAYAISVDSVRGPDAPPSTVVVNARYDSLQELSDDLWSQKDTLMLDEATLTQFVGPKGAGSGTGEGVVAGVQEDFLTLDVDVRPSAGTTAAASYTFSFDLPLAGSASPSAS